MRGAPTALETWGDATHPPSDPDSHQGKPHMIITSVTPLKTSDNPAVK